MSTWHVIFVHCLLLVWKVRADEACLTNPSSRGTRFMVGIMGDSLITLESVELILTTDDNANARVTVPFINYDAVHFLSKHLNISLNSSIAHKTNGSEFKGIEIESDKPISVTVLTSIYDRLEGYLALPVSTISTEYVVASYTPYSSYHSELLIVCVSMDTDIHLELPARYKSDPNLSDKLNIRLQPFESFQYQGPYDLSGAIVKSTKPVSVISGSSYSQVPIGVGDWQRLVEQMIPTVLWDYVYVLVPIYPRKQYLVRIFAREDNTTVNSYNNTIIQRLHLDRFGYTDLILDREPIYLYADKPIYVVEYGYDTDRNAGDPFMMNAQAVSQYQPKYEFFTQHFYPNNTLAVSVKTMDLPGLRLDGQKHLIESAPKFEVMSSTETYTVLFINVSSNSFHVIEHETNQLFGAVLYGLPHVSVAYGYPLQLQFRDTGVYMIRSNLINFN